MKCKQKKHPADFNTLPTHVPQGWGFIYKDNNFIEISVDTLLPSEARRLAKWLVRAADYLDERENRKRPSVNKP